ncbi:MAG: extracellular solute-binding protein [Clostridia bacterium]|nr:extracellular solute-binding protein [Clostridia bacterium]
MKRTRSLRFLALFLAMLTVISTICTGVAFAEDDGSVSDTTISDVKELLNAISYGEYIKRNKDVARATESILVNGLDYDSENTTAKVEEREYEGVNSVYVPNTGTIAWKVNVPATAKYSVKIKCYTVEAKSVAVQRIFRINGKVPFAEARYLSITKVWNNVYEDLNDAGRPFKTDIDNNELRPSMVQAPEWREYEFRDIDGFYPESFEFVLEAGENLISLESVSEPIAIASIELFPHVDFVSYESVKDSYDKNGYKPAEKGHAIKIEAEIPNASSSQTVYPLEDVSSSLNSPSDSTRTLLNVIGGDKWQTSGQWVRYKFTPEVSGLYNIVARYKQNVNDGLFSSRQIYIYGGQYNGIPFAEATKTRFNYSDEWVVEAMGDGENTFEFYFEAGVEYTVVFEVSLGSMGDMVRRVETALKTINAAYLNIIKLTGTSPDNYRDYGFTRVLPDAVTDMKLMSNELYAIAEYLEKEAGIKGSNIATLDRVAWLLDEMSSDEDVIAKNLSELKSYIGNLATWISTAKCQPLLVDYFMIQSSEDKLPRANAGFFSEFGYEMRKFFMSFIRDYDRMGSQHEITEEDEAIEVWLAYGRDQSQVIRNLVNNNFTPETGIMVDLKLVAGGTLLPSILAGKGPDVYIGLGQAEVINYAIRSALLPIEGFDGYDETIKAYNDAAMAPLGIAGPDEIYHCYGLPETQTFPMMFYRKDILVDLGIDIPKTWDDILEAVPVLQANKMEIGLSPSYNMFLYQMGGTQYADNGMRINLDSNTALEAFEMMCNMFTMYSFPYSYDFSNRFRTGEMPIGIAEYSGTYNQLIVFATEIKGLWGFSPLPGMMDENGEINNVSISTVTAICMIAGCEQPEKAWEFMRWQAGEQCQIDYSNEMVALLGDSAKHPTANRDALSSLPWTTDELANLELQFNNLASIPNYPGYYYIDRYTNFAFLDAYNNKANPVTELLSYINTINKEITRKREEFGLETLEIGQTLAEKRLGQAKDALSAVNGYEAQVQQTLDAIATGDNIEAISSAALALEAADAKTFATIAGYLKDAATALATYN